MKENCINAIKEINFLLNDMNANRFERIYDCMIEERNIASEELLAYCDPYKSANGLVAEHIWLNDVKCLQLKRDFNVKDSNFRLFIKTFKKETKALQVKRHNERKQKLNKMQYNG